MDRDELVLAALAAGGLNASYSPVQLQKLFFLLDNEAAEFVGGPHFEFVPYDYGPFDRSVYTAVEHLRENDLADVMAGGRYRRYALTNAGYAEGSTKLNDLAPEVQEYMRGLAGWVRSLSFNQLVAAIYNRYPAMKVNSVFEE